MNLSERSEDKELISEVLTKDNYNEFIGTK